MNAYIHFKFRIQTQTISAHRHRAFTLTELLVLIATLSVLALITIPALAGAQYKGGRMQCANNLRQLSTESMMYASDYNGWLPICNVGAFNSGGKVDQLGGVYYSRYVWLGTANTTVSQSNTNFQNLGLLYQTGLAGDLRTFYCPAQWGASVGANAYMPLLTSDSTGFIGASYDFNPRIVSPIIPNIARRYQKTSQLEPHKLFMVDFLENLTGPSVPGMPASYIAHFRELGWNVLFTDGSVQFSRPNALLYYDITRELVTEEASLSYVQYNTLYNAFEQDH